MTEFIEAGYKSENYFLNIFISRFEILDFFTLFMLKMFMNQPFIKFTNQSREKFLGFSISPAIHLYHHNPQCLNLVVDK
jgi:hypothetical protein